MTRTPSHRSTLGRFSRWARTLDGVVALSFYGLVGFASALILLAAAGVVRPERSAFETVRVFYLTASADRWDEARAHLSLHARTALDAAGAAGPALVLPAGGGIEAVYPVSVALSNRSQEAVVSVLLEGAAPQEGAGRALLDVRRERLVRQDGRWVLACPGELECPSP